MFFGNAYRRHARCPFARGDVGPSRLKEQLEIKAKRSFAPRQWKKEAKAPTSVSDQALVQVTGLEPGKPYLLALASEPSGTGVLEPLQGFMTNPAGAPVVNAIGPIRQLVRGEDKAPRRYVVILPGTPDTHGARVQVQRE